MKTWLNSEQLKEMIGKSVDTAQRIIKNHAQAYPLCVRKVKPVGSRPFYEVLWNTETNQPATLADQPTTGDHHEQPSDGNQNKANLADTERFLAATRTQNKASMGNQKTEQPRLEIQPISVSRSTRETGDIGGQQPAEMPPSSPLTGEDHEYTNHRTVSIASPRISAVPSCIAQAVQQPTAQSGRDANLDHAAGNAVVGTPPTVSHALLALAEITELRGERQASNGVQIPQGRVAEIDIRPFNALTAHDAVLLEGDNLPMVAANIDFHPESFDCQIHYVLRLIERHKLGKVCRSNALTAYFKTVLIADAHRADWDALLNNSQRIKFAEQYKLVGEIPGRLKAEGNPKSVTGRKSAVSNEAVAWISKTVQEWANDAAPVLTATRCRTDYMLQQLLKKDTGIVLSERQIANVVRKNNLRQLMNKPQGKEGKKVGKQKGTYPRLPVNSLWLMDGCVPELLYIRDLNGRYTKITCIGIEDVGSRKLLGFKPYYSESGASSVNLFKAVMTENQFKKGTSGVVCAPTLRPDKGSGFMTSMGACSFAIGKAYAEKYHFMIDFKEANAGSPTEKAHLESSWKSVHTTFRTLVQHHFSALGKIDKTPIVSNHKRGIEMSALYIDITLEELRDSGIAEEFKDLMNNRVRQFTEDNRTLRFAPNERWTRYLANLNDDDALVDPLPETVFSADDAALEMLNVFGYAKHDSNVRPDMTIQYKVGYNVPRDLGFSVTRSTPIRVSEMPDGSGRLAIFTAKEKKSKTKHDFGAEFLGFATVKVIGGNEEKATHVRRKKDERLAEVLEMAKKDTAYSLILKEIQPFLVSFGSESDVKGIDVLVGMKLTPELAYAVIAELCVDKETGAISKIEFKRFHIEARKRLQNILVLPTIQQRNMR